MNVDATSFSFSLVASCRHFGAELFLDLFSQISAVIASIQSSPTLIFSFQLLFNLCARSAGVCMSLKNPSLAVAVESCLRSLVKAFCCDNYHDEALLQELMSRYYPRGKRPQIIVCPFTKEVYNTEERSAAGEKKGLL